MLNPVAVLLPGLSMGEDVGSTSSLTPIADDLVDYSQIRPR